MTFIRVLKKRACGSRSFIDKQVVVRAQTPGQNRGR